MFIFRVTSEIVPADQEELDLCSVCEIVGDFTSLRDAIRAVGETRTNRVDGVECIECDELPVRAPRWVTVYNGMEFETGARESRALHLPEGLTAATRRRIASLVGAR